MPRLKFVKVLVPDSIVTGQRYYRLIRVAPDTARKLRAHRRPKARR